MILRHPLTIAIVLALTATACEQKQAESDFFDPGALQEGTVELGDDFTVVPCAGAEDIQRWEWHPRLVRGQVLAPGGALVRTNPLFDLLIPSAHAVPLEGESVVAEAEVTLIQGETTHATAYTDALGRFCLVVPEGKQLGPEWRVEAVGPGVTLRRVLLDALEADVSVQTEAVYRIVTGDNAAADVSEHTWRNVSTMSATVLDLTDPLEIPPGMSASDAVEQATDRLRKDDRISAAF